MKKKIKCCELNSCEQCSKHFCHIVEGEFYCDYLNEVYPLEEMYVQCRICGCQDKVKVEVENE